MNMKRTTLATALTAALALGAVGQASASIYARSHLDIDDLVIVVSDDGGATAGGATIDNFNFRLTNTASLNGSALAGSTASCSGLPGTPGGGTNNCSGVLPRLDADVVNAAGSAPLQGENTFTIHGPGLGQYSNADSVINTAQLTGDTFTNTEQIAESELQPGGEDASANAEIQSNTGFTFEFTVAGANQIEIDFFGALNILAAINDPTAASALAQANVGVEFQLSNDNDPTQFFSWTPNGSATGGCAFTFGNCIVSNGFDLNTDVGVSTDGASSGRNGSGNFSLLFTGLTDGDWSLTLNGLTSTNLSRTAAVPEPGMLALLGIGLAGLGFTRRRNRV